MSIDSFRCFELPAVEGVPHRISKLESRHSLEEAAFSNLCQFSRDPWLMTVGESRDINGLVNRDLDFLAQLFLHPKRTEQSPDYCK